MGHYSFKPKYLGYCYIAVTITDSKGNIYNDHVIVEVNPKLITESIMVNNNEKCDGEYSYGRIGEEVVINPVVTGGYLYDKRLKYTYEIQNYNKVTEAYESSGQVFDNLQSSEFKWTPDKEGKYRINIKVEDPIGSVSKTTIYYVAE